MNKIALLIPKYRNELFGFSILTILIFHFFNDISDSDSAPALMTAANIYNSVIFSVGVDIFLFLSGMGLYYSMYSRRSIAGFYKRRAARILPAYAVIGGIGWIIIDLVLEKTGFPQFLFDFSTVSFWSEGATLVWYISFILIMYLIFPLIFKMLSIQNRRLRDLITAVVVIALISGCIILSFTAPGFYENTEIALWRTVIFIIGSWFGCKICRKEKLTYEIYLLFGLGVLFMILTFITGVDGSFLWGIFKLRLQTVFYPIIIMIATTALISMFDGKAVNRGLRWLGKISLELYLSHVLIREIFKIIGLPTYIIWNYLIVIAISFAVSIVFHKAAETIKKLSTKKRTD